MKHKQLAKLLIIQFACLFLAVIIAIFLKPIGLNANSGVSYYAVQLETALIVSIGFCTASFFAFYAAWKFKAKKTGDKLIRICLFVAAICYVGLVLTPHDVIAVTHKIFGSTLFGIEFILAYFAMIYSRRKLDILLFVVAFFSGMLCLVYLFVTGYMIQAQLIFQLAVWMLYVRYLLK